MEGHLKLQDIFLESEDSSRLLWVFFPVPYLSDGVVVAGVELLQLPHPDVEHLHLLVRGADSDTVPTQMEVQVERPSLLIGEHV